jgi:hypothetical protein
MSDITGGLLPTITLPGTYHHLMFDDPMTVAMTMKMLFLEWHKQDNQQSYDAELAKTLGTL